MKVTKYSEIKMGQSAEVVHTITKDDIQTFGDLSGDYNPLHFDEDWAKTTMFGSRIAHGLLTASFISTAIGMHLPGAGRVTLKTTCTNQKGKLVLDGEAQVTLMR
jgi:3-hydroxybutyryl-CoA dehydratase